jgi:hypothetical protein
MHAGPSLITSSARSRSDCGIVKPIDPALHGRAGGRAEIAEPVHPARLLCADGERRGEETADDTANERSPNQH